MQLESRGVRLQASHKAWDRTTFHIPSPRYNSMLCRGAQTIRLHWIAIPLIDPGNERFALDESQDR